MQDVDKLSDYVEVTKTCDSELIHINCLHLKNVT